LHKAAGSLEPLQTERSAQDASRGLDGGGGPGAARGLATELDKASCAAY